MSQPYDHIKQAGLFSDHAGGIVGGNLGFLAGLAPFAITAFSSPSDLPRLAPLIPFPFVLGSAGTLLGSALIDTPRLKKKVQGKTMDDYRFSKAELKELGLSKEEINEILKYPTHTKKAAIKAALDVKDKEFFLFRPVSATLGKILADPAAKKIMGIPTETASLKNTELQTYIDSVKDHPSLENVAVYLGSSRVLDKLKRIWKNENNSLMDKLYTSATLPSNSFWEALGRVDHFDPSSNTLTVYHDSPAILAHELGHALDYNTAKEKDLWRQLYSAQNPVPQEYLASNLAVNKLTENLFKDKVKLKDKQSISDLLEQAQQLEKALSTYGKVYGSYGVADSVKEQDRKAKTALEFFLSHPKYAKKIKALLKKHKLTPTLHTLKTANTFNG